MSENRPNKKKIEFIESYYVGVDGCADYQWNDNHGELIRCANCIHGTPVNRINLNGTIDHIVMCQKTHDTRTEDWYCADGKKKDYE